MAEQINFEVNELRSLSNLDEIDQEGSSATKGNGMDRSEVKGDDLLICSPAVPGLSLGNSRWGKHLTC